MANRLSLLLPKLISEEQGAFQHGKVIIANIGVASELTNMMASKCRGGTLGMKLDVQKAYDMLDWNFLFVVLGKFGFSQCWIGWIKEMMRSTKMVKKFLDNYQIYSGQKINLEKNKIFVGNMFALRRGRVKEVLQIPECVFPTRYLGVDLFKGRVKKDFTLPLVDKFKARLAGWKGRLLSMAGRVELVRSVICSILMHNFSVYLWPASSVELMERWIQNFIWSGDANISKSITVRWSKLCKPKCEGGLGVRRLKEINLALLAKLAWFMKNDNSSFAKFLRGRLIKADGSLKQGVKSSILPGIRKDKVADYIDDGEWQLPTPRSLELQEVSNQILQVKLPTTEHEDKRVWALTEWGVFSVKSA
ncbi:uncharacterized protein LOC122644954 [Telopea speciosissima]|uniref:uncharacterized protein LOC122644954 n=1 Tax=Telopea speciosissima TaxID=54955 RepID=UPI001CC34EF5|nr:uncharacterized protein LOC122644954 [Telopea speciosissima]